MRMRWRLLCSGLIRSADSRDRSWLRPKRDAYLLENQCPTARNPVLLLGREFEAGCTSRRLRLHFLMACLILEMIRYMKKLMPTAAMMPSGIYADMGELLTGLSFAVGVDEGLV